MEFRELEEKARQFAPMFSALKATIKYKDSHIEVDFEGMPEISPQFTVMLKDALVGMLDRFGIKGEIIRLK